MDQGATQDVRTMLHDAIMAVQAASASGQEAAARVEQQATNPELKEMMKTGSTVSDGWTQRLSTAASAMGGQGAGSQAGNPIIDSIQQVGGKIIHAANDPKARDLGIIATSQLALHYYIAAFGTMAAYAKLLGLTDVASAIHACLDEAKAGDERYTDLAGKIAA